GIRCERNLRSAGHECGAGHRTPSPADRSKGIATARRADRQRCDAQALRQGPDRRHDPPRTRRSHAATRFRRRRAHAIRPADRLEEDYGPCQVTTWPNVRRSGASRNPAPCSLVFVLSSKSSASAPLRGAGYFLLSGQEKVTKEKATPEGALSGPPALQVRERASGFVGRTSVYVPRTRAPPARDPADFSSARSPHLRGPRLDGIL